MLLALPFLAVPFPDEPPDTTPAPATTCSALAGITFHSDWDGSTAKALTEAANGGGSGDAAINAVVDVCCAPDEAVAPECSEISGGSRPAGETHHTIAGWESAPSMEHEELVMAFHRPVDTTVGQTTVTHDDLFLASRQTGGGDYWCLPTAASFNNTVSCIDNDPHLTAGATSVYFDSNRDAPTTPEFRCLRGIAEDFRVYHSRKVSGAWTTPEQVVNGPNLVYIDWEDEQQQPIAACANCPNDDPDVCPIPCAPSADKVGKPVYNGRQPAVTEDEKTMYFLGNGPYCRPETPAIPADEENPAVWETLEKNTGPCIYRTDRVGTSDPPEWGTGLPRHEARVGEQPALPIRPGDADGSGYREGLGSRRAVGHEGRAAAVLPVREEARHRQAFEVDGERRDQRLLDFDSVFHSVGPERASMQVRQCT